MLYFDLGNVLLGFCHERMCRQMAEVAGLDFAAVHDLLFTKWDPDCPQWQLEDGRLSADGYYALFCEQTRTRPDRTRLERAAADIFWPLESSVALLHRLAAAGHRLGLLSNINPIHWGFVGDGRYPWLQRPGLPGSLFSSVVLSYESRAMKPDPQIYSRAVSLAGVEASQVFFVDDRGENVAGALAAGLDAVQFTGIDQLHADLIKRGYLPV